eukprot:503302-Amphidinium_carterae.1
MVRSRSSSSKKVPLQRAHWDVEWAWEGPPGPSSPKTAATGSCSVTLSPSKCCSARGGGATCASLS